MAIINDSVAFKTSVSGKIVVRNNFLDTFKDNEKSGTKIENYSYNITNMNQSYCTLYIIVPFNRYIGIIETPYPW